MIEVIYKSKEQVIGLESNNISLNTDIVDPNLNLPEDTENSKNSNILEIKENLERSNLKTLLSLELCKEILGNPFLSEEKKEQIKYLISKINENKYYYCYEKLINLDSEIIKIFKKPILLTIPKELNYDLEMYIIGKICKKLKKRYAIIKHGMLYSSKEPLMKINLKKLKDKTPFLNGAQIIIETKDTIRKDQRERSNKNKKYRIIINYSIVKNNNKPTFSSFFLYFDDEKKMEEVFLILFKMSLKEYTKNKITKNLADINNTLTQSCSFFTLLKILSVKNKIKKRKIVLNTIQRGLNSEPIAKLKVDKNLLKNLSKNRIEKPEIDSEQNSNHIKSQETSSFVPSLSNTFNNIEVDLEKKLFSDFMPLISNISPLCSKLYSVSLNKNLNNSVKNYQLLKKLITTDIVHNKYKLSTGVCFSLPNGVEINYNEDINNENNNFKLEQNSCNNSKFLYFNKNKPEIQFKADNNDINNSNSDEDFSDANVLSGENIYEISNVVLNSNINLSKEEENNLVIIGPKIKNNKEIGYKYKNDNNNSYSDPEIFALKNKTINKNNHERINGFNLMIIQSVIDVNKQSIIYNLLASITRSLIPEINETILKEHLLFGYKIKLSYFKSIDSLYFTPKSYKDNKCFIQYNNQHFLPKEYLNENSIIIIECFCLPVISFNEKIYKIPDDKRELIGKLLSPIKIGIAKIDINNLKHEYFLENNGKEEKYNSLTISGGYEKIDNIHPVNIEGKDYSIGSDSYLLKVINKDFIDKAKNNPEIKNEIKNKYFNVCFDNEFNKNFLFRPNEDMKENEFFEDISKQISEEEIQKIKNNKNYTFLPYCEKYIDENTLNKSQNLKCLTKQEKNYILKNYQKGQWIYKFPEIKVKLLSKNLGVIISKNQLIQKLYSTGEKQFLNIYNLGKDENKLILISENNFNIFDMKEINDMKNFDNFQWKISIKFKNPLQMNSFLKLLILARQNINMKKKSEIQKKKFELDPNKILYFDDAQKFDQSKDNECSFNEQLSIENKKSTCVIKLEFIKFRADFIIENDPTILEVILSNERQRINLDYLYDSRYGFKNSLLNEIENLLSKKEIGKFHQIKLDKSKFNNGKKNISLKKNITQFDFNKNLINKNSYRLEIFLDKKDEYFSELDLKEIINETMCNKLELPIYKKNDENKKIYGGIGIDIYELQNNSDKTFEERFEELNKNYLYEPLLVIEELLKKDFPNFKSLNYHIELYEPNIYKRYILNFIHNEKDINIDPCDMKNNLKDDLDILYDRLYKKYAILPSRDGFQFFNFNNIKKNFGRDNNPFKKELGLKLLKIQRHGLFLQLFRVKEWELYLNEIKGENTLSGIDYFKDIKDKRILLNDKIQAKKLHNLIYIGIPSLEYREIIYTILLEIDKLYDETKTLIKSIYKKDVKNKQECFNFFVEKLFDNEQETNLIFSLIDNDSIFISSLDTNTYEDIICIKKIAKSFFIWAKLRIGLNNNEDKYIYFIGLLSIIQKLRQYFKKDYLVFWLLVGLSQYISLFNQENQLFSDNMNYINIYGLVTKLILERHIKQIYDKFITLNFPPEFFLSQHLSTLYTDYFKDEFMMRIFDILIFESAFQGLYGDKLQYLRILCAIPITLFELSQDKILLCKSVSEIETIFNDLISHTLNHNKFIFALGKNVKKFYVWSSIFEKWFCNNKGREWDAKRDEMQNLIYQKSVPIYKENCNYLLQISKTLVNNDLLKINDYFENINNKFNSIKPIYGPKGSNINDSNSISGIIVHISKLQQIYNNDLNLDEYNLIISFGDDDLNIGEEYSMFEVKINFDSELNKIKNTSDLFIKAHFEEEKFPKNIYFFITDNQENDIASFSYQILYYEPMKISKIVLENKEENNKYFMEIVLFKYSLEKLSDLDADMALFNTVFSSPEYLHSKTIEEKLNSYSISNYSFDKGISKIIKESNTILNYIVDTNDNLFDKHLVEMYKKLNNIEEQEDKYNNKKIINNDEVLRKAFEILDSCLEENIHDIIHKWITNSNISIEEILYSIIIIDKSLISINDKLFLLYSIAQAKDKLLFNTDKISINKVKEMVYSLYKRFMIYFTKTDVERMIDFLLKDERLFTIKYAFVYNNKDAQKINDLIYDKDYYEPKFDDKKKFEIYFDDINKDLNIFLNYLNNHYNMNCLPKDILIFVLTNILNNKGVDNYIKNKFDKITLVIEKDNLMYKRNFTIDYLQNKIVEDKDQIFEVSPNNPKDIANIILSYRISFLDANNSYNINNYISYDKFKEIFFKLPFLSNLFRVTFSYISENIDIYNKEFEYVKVSIGYKVDNYHQIFYFPDIIERDYNNNRHFSISMDKKIKITNTIDSIINDINIRSSNLNLEEFKTNFDKLNCYVCYYENENQREKIIKEKIGYFECLYSCMELKNKNYIEIQIIYDKDYWTFFYSRNPIIREPGYCKIFYSKDNDFIWKKCKVISQNITDAKLNSTDYKTKLKINNLDDDVVLLYNI